MSPLLVPHSGRLVGPSGGLASTDVALTPEVLLPIFSCRPPLPPLRGPRPMAAPRSRIVSGRGRGFPGVTPASPCTPMYCYCAALLCGPWRLRQRFTSPLRPPPHSHLFLLRL